MPSTRPNVIVFFTDQQRHDSTGLGGNPLGLTPNFDRLARRGTYFPLCFTPQPVCGPARSCLQSGRYATETGCWKNGIPLPPGESRLAPAFREAGYRTGYIGKWHLGQRASFGPVEQEERGGYEYWLAANCVELVSDAYEARLYDNDNQEVRLPGYRADALTDAAIRFVNDNQSDPFFLFLSFLEPHHQNHRDDYPAPDGYAEQYAGRWTPPDLAALGGSTQEHLAGYWGMVKRLDECLGRLQDTLKSLGLEENTVVAFISDHGCHFKTRNSEYKRSCHEASIRVPCALWGGPFTDGGEQSDIVSLIDLPPTLLETASLPVPEIMRGHSWLPLARGEASERPMDAFIQISEAEVGRAIRTKRWKYAVTAPGRSGGDVPAGETYVESSLYDLEADPYELVNLAGSAEYKGVREELRARLLEWMGIVGEGEVEIAADPSKE